MTNPNKIARWFVALPYGERLRPLTFQFVDAFDARQALAQVRNRFPTARVVRVVQTKEIHHG